MSRPTALVLALAACTSPSLGRDESAIIGGVRSTGASATIMLAGYPNDRSVLHACTAVLVSPTVALTSAHCIDAPNHPNYNFGVFAGDDASPYPTLAELEPHLAPVASVHPHHQYSTTLPFFADIGAIVLASPLPNTPIPMQRTPIDQTIVGKPALIVGYGQTVYNQFNQVRYEAMTNVGAIEDDTIVVGDNQKRPCLGDSGGPAIVGGMLVGIDSYGPVGCDGPAHYRRVDFFQPFIAQYIPPPAGGADAGVTDPGDDPPPTDDGGCTTGSGAGLAALLALAGVRRRRRA